MDDQTVATYNKLAQEYDKETADFWEQFPCSVFDEFVARLTGTRVLNVGSGPGRDGLLLQDRGISMECVDASEQMVQMCIGRGLSATVGDVLALPFGNKQFDGVWAYTSLLHIHKSDMPRALQEIRRVLKPASVFGVGMIEGEGEQYRESSGVGMPRWFAYYTQEELEQYLTEAGFRIHYREVFKPRSKEYLNIICTLR